MAASILRTLNSLHQLLLLHLIIAIFTAWTGANALQSLYLSHAGSSLVLKTTSGNAEATQQH